MRNVYLQLSIIILSILCLHLSSCKPEPDPCLDKKETSAEFYFYQEPKYWEGEGAKWETPDTALTGFVSFIARHDAESYEWKIGQDTNTFRQKSFSLRFDEPYDAVPVRLIVKRTPDKLCFPLDDGFDTVYKTLVIVPFNEPPVNGKYYGSLIHKPDSFFFVEVGNSKVTGIYVCDWIRCPTCPKGVDIHNAPYGFGMADASCNGPAGYGQYDRKTGTLTIQYEEWKPFPDRVKRTFKGKRQ